MEIEYCYEKNVFRFMIINDYILYIYNHYVTIIYDVALCFQNTIQKTKYIINSAQLMMIGFVITF